MKKLMLLMFLFLSTSSISYGNEIDSSEAYALLANSGGSVITGLIGYVYIEYDRLFVEVGGGANASNPDNCHGFYISRDHLHFNEVFSSILAAKYAAKSITVYTKGRCTVQIPRQYYEKLRLE